MKLKFLVMLMLFPFAFSGCESASSTDSQSGTNSNPTSAVTPDPPPVITSEPPITITIPAGASTMGAAAFGQNPLTIPIGTTVTWVNDDTVQHTVTDLGGSFDSNYIQPGESWSFTFNDIETFTYEDAYYGFTDMNGCLVVQDPTNPGTPAPCVGLPD